MSHKDAGSSKRGTSQGPETFSHISVDTPAEILQTQDDSSFRRARGSPTVSSSSTNAAAESPRTSPPRQPAKPTLPYIGITSGGIRSQGPQYRGSGDASIAAKKLSTQNRAIVHEIRNFKADEIFKPMANPFSNFASITDLLADVDRTLGPIDPLHCDNEGQFPLNTTALKPNDEDPEVDPSHRNRLQSARGKASESYRPRGLSVADINLLNAAWERDGGKERQPGSSIATLNSGGQIRREVKFNDQLETRSLFHGTGDEREDGNALSDDESIDLEGGIYSSRRGLPRDGNETCFGDKNSDDAGSEDARLKAETAMESSLESAHDLLFREPILWPGVHEYGPNRRISSSGGDEIAPEDDVSASALGLAHELRRMSLLLPEDLVIPGPNHRVLDADMVGGLPTWEFKKAGLDQFVSATDVKHQEALFDAYEQGHRPEAMKESTPEEELSSKSSRHLFVFDRVQPRAAANTVASSSGEGRAKASTEEVAGVDLQIDEVFEDEEGIEEVEEGDVEEVGEEEFTQRALLENLEKQPVGKGKGRAE